MKFELTDLLDEIVMQWIE